jgi:hypothetical protein
MSIIYPPEYQQSPPQPPPLPPPHRSWPRRHKILTALGSGFGLLVVLIIVITATSAPSVTKASAPATTAPAAATSAPAASSPAPTPSAPLTATVGSTFKVTDSSGNVYNVTLQKIIDPAAGSDQFNQPDNGTRFVAAVFQVTGVSGTATDDTNSDASLTGSNQQVYEPNFNTIAGYTNFNGGDFNVTPGQSETGAVTFQVPSGVNVANIQWTVGFSNSTATWNMP